MFLQRTEIYDFRPVSVTVMCLSFAIKDIWRTSTVIRSGRAWASGSLLVVRFCPAVSISKTLCHIRTCLCDITRVPYTVQLAVISHTEISSQFVLLYFSAIAVGLPSLYWMHGDAICLWCPRMVVLRCRPFAHIRHMVKFAVWWCYFTLFF